MDDSELADIKAAIMDQWRSMAGMGAMFVSSILFGVFIQPFYNFYTDKSMVVYRKDLGTPAGCSPTSLTEGISARGNY